MLGTREPRLCDYSAQELIVGVPAIRSRPAEDVYPTVTAMTATLNT
ncbi:hypothetical protein [Nocardia nova]|nr:hypothetical protein [Nocardia nova]